MTAVILPFTLKVGVASCLPVFEVLMEEWESDIYPRLELTSEHLEWDPTSTIFQEQEESMTKWDGTTHDNLSARRPSLMISSVSHSTTECAANIVDDFNFAQVLESHVTSSLSKSNISSTTGSFKTKSQQPVDCVTLANRWNISKDNAKQAIDKTTQRGVRTVLFPYLSSIYPTNYRGMRYDRTNHPLFTDTLIAVPLLSVVINMTKFMVQFSDGRMLTP